VDLFEDLTASQQILGRFWPGWGGSSVAGVYGNGIIQIIEDILADSDAGGFWVVAGAGNGLNALCDPVDCVWYDRRPDMITAKQNTQGQSARFLAHTGIGKGRGGPLALAYAVRDRLDDP